MLDYIKQIYLEDKWTYDSMLPIDFNESDDDRRYYVYEWLTDNGKVFYVGKGTGKRYEHILKEIKMYEANPRKYKGEKYKILNDNYGIHHNIILNDLTECEAYIMETYYMIKYLREHQPLLNQDVPCFDEEEDIEKFWYDVHYGENFLDYYK